ncbi:gluconate 2-dehydrogenase subunit 3 family protein [Rheinheimera oceanensis]|uniref:gluconate 2-dehydrogenase subunit 3 family protein n=1 Tax=Rheinheimera oceanensis TaxID=2817449 RepID=UPI001BFE709F|nr:gluconate 2-dehydrogenase subunit 3 family protein [Rheinheimera oceanensis]
MDRRDLLKMIAAATGMAMVGGDVWAAGVKSADAGTALFTAADIAFMDEIAETILPKTTTPGAKDAACGAMMAVMVADCYELKYQTVFFDGLKTIKNLAKQQFGKDFMQLSAAQKHQLLTTLDQQAKQSINNPLPHYFILIKQLTLMVFFTSKVGATEVLRYVAIPGRYDGNLPYKKGDRAWAT